MQRTKGNAFGNATPAFYTQALERGPPPKRQRFYSRSTLLHPFLSQSTPIGVACYTCRGRRAINRFNSVWKQDEEDVRTKEPTNGWTSRTPPIDFQATCKKDSLSSASKIGQGDLTKTYFFSSRDFRLLTESNVSWPSEAFEVIFDISNFCLRLLTFLRGRFS